MNQKLGDWLRRYVPAEVGGIVGSIVVGLLLYSLTGSESLTAVGGTVGESVGYYAVIFLIEAIKIGKKRMLRTRSLGIIARNIVVEFGLAEALDAFVIRPFLIYAALQITNNIPVGLVVGKIGADIVFYGLTILMYEYRKKRFAH